MHCWCFINIETKFSTSKSFQRGGPSACSDLPIQQQGAQFKVISSQGLRHSISLRPWWASSLLTTLITLPIIFLCNLSPVDTQHLETLFWFPRESLQILLAGEMSNSWGNMGRETGSGVLFFFPVRAWEGFSRECIIKENHLPRVWGHPPSLLPHPSSSHATFHSPKGPCDPFFPAFAQNLFLSFI